MYLNWRTETLQTFGDSLSVQPEKQTKHIFLLKVYRQHSFLLSGASPISICPSDWSEKMGIKEMIALGSPLESLGQKKGAQPTCIVVLEEMNRKCHIGNVSSLTTAKFD